MPFARKSLTRVLPRPTLRKGVKLAGNSLVVGAALMTLTATNDLRAEDQVLATEARKALSVTVYQNGMGLIHDDRWVPLIAGRTTLAVDGTNPAMIPESLVLSSEQGGLSLVEQSRLPATLTPSYLLEDAVGKEVWLITRNSQTGEDTREKARLLSLAQGPVLQVGDRVEINPPGRIVLPQLPAGLRAKPGLKLVIESRETTNGLITLAYLADGLDWQADYVATLSDDGSMLTLVGRVSLSNQSGGDLEDAQVQLVAGEVTRRSQADHQPRAARMMMAEAKSMADMGASAPVATGERYLYQLTERVNLAAGERKQLTLTELTSLPVQKRFTFDGLMSPQGPDQIGPVQARLSARFTNPDNKATGKPLPAGLIRVYGPQANGRSLFLGEDRIQHTAAGNEVELDLGEAFDVSATGRLLDLNRLSQRRYEAEREVVITNAKSEAVVVEVTARLPREWKILSESHPHQEESAREVTWKLEVPANGKTILIARIEAGN
ncbi:DUF4139 domain-containing protein [Rhodovibrionaceae bacterium A322]